NLEPAAHADAVDGGNQRLVEIKPLDKAGVAVLRIFALAAVRLGRHGLKIAARAEGALPAPGEDGDILILIGSEGIERGLEFLMHQRIDGVHHLRPLEGDARDVIVRTDGNVLIAHKAPSSRRIFLPAIITTAGSLPREKAAGQLFSFQLPSTCRQAMP